MKILDRFGMSDCKSAVTPGDHNVKLRKLHPEEEPETFFPYREAVGSLLYAAMVSRPDIAFPVCNVAKFCERPGSIHVTAVKRIMRYLKGSPDKKLTFGHGSLNLTSYCDADWAGCLDTRKSIAGKVHILNGGAVSWASRKLQTVALSTTEAEYMALTDATKDIIWLRQLLGSIGLHQKYPSCLFSDNKGALDLAQSTECFHSRSKHIDIRYHFIKDVIEKGIIKLQFVPTENQPADFLTKNLVGPKLHHCCELLNII